MGGRAGASHRDPCSPLAAKCGLRARAQAALWAASESRALHLLPRSSSSMLGPWFRLSSWAGPAMDACLQRREVGGQGWVRAGVRAPALLQPTYGTLHWGSLHFLPCPASQVGLGPLIPSLSPRLRVYATRGDVNVCLRACECVECG